MEVMLDLGSSSSKSQLGWSFRGHVEKISFKNLSVVFAESWPGWVFVLKGLGWKNMVVLVKNKLKFKHLWKNISDNNVIFKAWSERRNVLSSLKEKDSTIWMEGSYEFVSTINKEVEKISSSFQRIGVC